MKTLKVYWTGQAIKPEVSKWRGNGSPQVHAVMATTSLKKFADAIGTTVGCLKNYYSITANKNDVKICLDNPEQVFYNIESTSLGYVDEYYRWDYVPSDKEIKRSIEKRHKERSK